VSGPPNGVHPWEAALDGELTREAREHLASCESCRESVRRVQGAATVLLAGIPEPPPGLDVRVLARVEQERQAELPPRRRSIRIPLPHLRLPVRPLALGLAATAVAVLALVLVRPSSLISNDAQGVGIVPLSAHCSGGQQLVVAGVWSGKEAASFAKVLGRFQERTGIQVIYAYQTRSIATKLESLVKRGCAPDVAMLPQPGTMSDLARRGALRPLGPVVGNVLARNYSPAWRQLGSVDGTLYGVWFKAAAKSMIWYRPDAFRKAGIQRPPRTWAELLADAQRLRAVGIQPFAIGGADGWTLTDWFSNVYLATAGPARYQALAEHRIKWTDPSVKRALSQLATIFGDRSLSGPLALSSKSTFEQSVAQVFGPHPRAAMVFEGDFVRSFLPAELAGSRAPFFAFPTPTPQARPPVAVGGDVAVLFSKAPAAARLIRYLASPAAAELWARAGGFISPNRNVGAKAYPDALTRQLAAGIADAPTIRFGLSDQEPPAFGSDPYQGMWLMFQRFLARPDQVDALTRKLEAGATAALACERAVAGDC
jgi:alpha-glucoside transport system substrate-binding protein